MTSCYRPFTDAVSFSFLPLNGRDQSATAAVISMFSQINPLPGTQVKTAFGDWNTNT